MVEKRDLIPLQAIKEAGSLAVPQQLSRQTAGRLKQKGWVVLEAVSHSTVAHYPHYRAHLTDSGLAAWAAADEARYRLARYREAVAEEEGKSGGG